MSNGHEGSSRTVILAVFVVLTALSATHALGQEAAPDATAASPEPRHKKNCRFRQLAFSPDGKYILAQHASGIAVLTVQPLSVLFSQSAENVSNAGFTPDSLQVWFVSRPSHVIAPQITFAGSSAFIERWRIADGTRIDRKETRMRKCESSGLSPDSRILACVDTGGTLRAINVDSGETLFEKKKFSNFGDRGAADLNFSPTDATWLPCPSALKAVRWPGTCARRNRSSSVPPKKAGDRLSHRFRFGGSSDDLFRLPFGWELQA